MQHLIANILTLGDEDSEEDDDDEEEGDDDPQNPTLKNLYAGKFVSVMILFTR